MHTKEDWRSRHLVILGKIVLKMFPAPELTALPPPAQVVFPSLEVTKVSLFIVFPPLPWRCFPLSKFSECRCVSSFPLCPGGVSRPQNVAMIRFPPSAQVVLPGFEMTNSLFIMWCFLPSKLPKRCPLCQGGVSCPRSYQSVTIYHVPPLRTWCFPPSKLPKCRY